MDTVIPIALAFRHSIWKLLVRLGTGLRDLTLAAWGEVKTVRRKALVERAANLARQREHRIALTAKGANPCHLTYTVGVDAFVFADLQRHIAAREAFRYPLTQQHLKVGYKPPRTLSRWSRSDLRRYVKTGERPSA